MNLNKLIAAVLSLSFVAGAATNLPNYAQNYSVKANADGETTVVTTTAVTTTKAVATTTTKATVTTVAVTAKAATTKANETTTNVATATATNAAETTTAKPVTAATTSATSTSVVTSVTTISATTSTNPTDYNLGDINNDGQINAVDASSVLAYYAKLSTNQNGGYDESQELAADVNHDGQINAVDASGILSYYAYVSTSNGELKTLDEFLNGGKEVKTVMPSVQNNPIHDFSMNYDIDLSTPTWIGNDCDEFGGDYKMSESFPSAEKLNNLLSNSFVDLSDYRCVATIVYNAHSAYGKGYRTVELEHIFLDNDITELTGRWNNEKTGIIFTNIGFACEKQHTRISDKESEWYRQTSVGIGSSSAIYTNIPIVLDDGTVLEPHKAVPLEKINNVQITEDSGKKTITLDNYSSYSKTFTVPDWYDIDLRNPAWEGINTETNERCDKFGGDFKMEEIFPNDELINNALSLKVGGKDNYKCVATIVRNTSRSRGAGRQITLEHLFVENDVNELKGRWNNNQKNGITFTNISYCCGNLVNLKSNVGEVGWTKSTSYGLGVGNAIYTNIPIIINDENNKEIDTVIEPYFMYGDVNNDGVIDIEDACMIIDFLNGDNELPDVRARKAADVNRDGVIDEKDITDSEDHINGKKPINDSNTITNDNDSDSDGLTDLEEYKLGTNRFNPDTDGDGLLDGDEREKDPLHSGADNDIEQLYRNTDPTKYAKEMSIDSDNDGIHDYYDDEPYRYNKPGTVYNREAVVAYMKKYGKEVGNDYVIDPENEKIIISGGKRRIVNPKFKLYGDQYCTEFASECLNAGGYEMTDDWCNYGEDGPAVGTWTTAPKLLKIMMGESHKYTFCLVDDIFVVKNEKELRENINKIKPGDILFWGNSDNTINSNNPEHAAVVYHVDYETGDLRYCSYTSFKDPNYYSTSDPNILSQKITNSVWVAHVNPYFYTLKQFLSNNAFELIGIAYNEDNHTLAYEAACNKYGKEYIDSLPLK